MRCTKACQGLPSRAGPARLPAHVVEEVLRAHLRVELPGRSGGKGSDEEEERVDAGLGEGVVVDGRCRVMGAGWLAPCKVR